MEKNLSLMVCHEQNGDYSSLCPERVDENYGVSYSGSRTSDKRVATTDLKISDIDDITFLGIIREYYPDIVRTFLTGYDAPKNAKDSDFYPRIFGYLNNLWKSRELGGTILKAFGPFKVSMRDCTLQKFTPEQNQDLSLMNSNLKSLINEPNLQLQEFVRDGIILLAAFAEDREGNSGGHVFRIGQLTREICQGMGLPSAEVDDISFSSMLHDVGMIQIPGDILLKPGLLNDEEYRIMQGHCVTGEEMVGDKPVYRTAREIARSHHERWDGTGYPDGLRGESIPLNARIVAIADAFDALTHERCYKKTWPARMALYEMKALSGRQFDPKILDVFLKIEPGTMKHGKLVDDLP
jgi:response regulator RpfG family c-di-GMP phosphodiesterase